MYFRSLSVKGRLHALVYWREEFSTLNANQIYNRILLDGESARHHKLCPCKPF